MSKFQSRLAKLEAGTRSVLSEAARAWLGLRPPLTPDELAEDREQLTALPDNLSPEAREWLAR